MARTIPQWVHSRSVIHPSRVIETGLRRDRFLQIRDDTWVGWVVVPWGEADGNADGANRLRLQILHSSLAAYA
jgi:hypothetical protein